MSFDLRTIVAELPQEFDTVDFTFNLKLAKEVKDARAEADLDEAKIADLEEQLKRQSYTAHLIPVPRGRRQEVYEESLEEFKPSLLTGRADEKTQFVRQNYVRVHIVAAAIIKITAPDGSEQVEDIVETIQVIHDKAPDQVFERIESKVNAMNDKADEQDALNHDADF